MSNALLSPRGRGTSAYRDVGRRAALVARQRVGRAPRVSRRRLARWLRAAGCLAAGLLVAAGTGAAWHWLETAPGFAVAAVEVRGTSLVAPERILEVAGIEPGTRLWRLNARGVAARLETIPEVRRAEVIRELPNRVTIAIEERRPFTLVHAGRLHWLDEEGRALGEQREAVAPPVPVVSGLTEEEVLSARTEPAPRTRAALALIRALLRSGSGLATEISEINMSRSEGPVLYTVGGVEVRLGREDWEERLARLEGVLAQLADADVGLVDLRFRDQVILRREGR